MNHQELSKLSPSEGLAHAKKMLSAAQMQALADFKKLSAEEQIEYLFMSAMSNSNLVEMLVMTLDPTFMDRRAAAITAAIGDEN